MNAARQNVFFGADAVGDQILVRGPGASNWQLGPEASNARQGPAALFAAKRVCGACSPFLGDCRLERRRQPFVLGSRTRGKDDSRTALAEFWNGKLEGVKPR